MAMLARTAAGSQSAVSTPSQRMVPLPGWYRLHNSLARVVLPEPFSPTRGQHLATADLQAYPVEHRLVPPGIGEAQILDGDAGEVPGRADPAAGRRHLVQEVVDVGDHGRGAAYAVHRLHHAVQPPGQRPRGQS